MLDLVACGELFAIERFVQTPPALRRLNDIAFSGDGEPTTCPEFPQLVEAAPRSSGRHGLDDVKLVLITNATMFHRPTGRARRWTLLVSNGGEIWAKLDAGSEGYYRLVNRSAVPWRQILDNLRDAAIVRPIVIQSLLMRIDGQSPPPAELEAYCDRLKEIVAAGGRIKLIQVHTIARKPAEAWVDAPTDAEMDAMADEVRRRTGLPVAAFYGGVCSD